MELFSISDILKGGTMPSITWMKFKKHDCDDIYSFTNDGQLKIKKLVPTTETYRWLIFTRTRVTLVPEVKVQLISNVRVEKFRDFYPKYAEPWIKFTSNGEQFTVYRPNFNYNYNEQEWLETVQKFGEEIIGSVNKTLRW